MISHKKRENVTEVAKLCSDEVFVLFCFAKKEPSLRRARQKSTPPRRMD
jgi:hypothetical protein